MIMKKRVYFLAGPLAVALTAMPAMAAVRPAGNDPQVEALAVVAEGDTVAAGAEAVLTARVSGGTAPFTLAWTNGLREEIGTATLGEAGTATTGYAPAECDLYYVTVTDANGKQAADTCRVIVTGEAVAATMENLWLDEESAWAGPDTKGEAVTGTYGDTQMAGSFVSGSYSFSNNYSLDWGSWSGFAYSNSTSAGFESLSDQYNSATGGGHDGSANFAVAFDSGTITVLNAAGGDTISGLYITNNAYALNSIKNGDGYSQPFTDGSFLKVTFTGTRADGTTATVEHYLADYRQASAADHYYLDTWQWVDLRSLGRVLTVSFAMDGSDKSYGYLNTPAYFCLDDLNGNRTTAEAAVQTGRSVELASLFSFATNEGTVSYALPDSAYDGTAGMASLTADGRLVLADGVTGRLSVVVSATQRGKTEFVSVPFDITSGIGAPEAAAGAPESRYSLGGQRLGAARKGVNIVRMKDGTVRKVVVK